MGGKDSCDFGLWFLNMNLHPISLRNPDHGERSRLQWEWSRDSDQAHTGLFPPDRNQTLRENYVGSVCPGRHRHRLDDYQSPLPLSFFSEVVVLRTEPRMPPEQGRTRRCAVSQPPPLPQLFFFSLSVRSLVSYSRWP